MNKEALSKQGGAAAMDMRPLEGLPPNEAAASAEGDGRMGGGAVVHSEVQGSLQP
ncbi:unnamed protein product, partial [Heterosigma akashiwo]